MNTMTYKGSVNAGISINAYIKDALEEKVEESVAV